MEGVLLPSSGSEVAGCELLSAAHSHGHSRARGHRRVPPGLVGTVVNVGWFVIVVLIGARLLMP